MKELKSYPERVFRNLNTFGSFRPTYQPFIEEMEVPTFPFETPRGGIASSKIEKIIPVMKQGINEMRSRIIKGEYTALIGDDTSGRIPTLIIRGVMSAVDKAYGAPTIPAIFVKGNLRELSTPVRVRLLQNLERLSSKPVEQRALIVTEFIASGNHLKSIGDVIHQAGIPFDVFALGRYSDTQTYRNRGILEDDEFIFPTVNYPSRCPDIYGATELSGYRTDFNDQVVFYPEPKEDFLEARKDIKKVIATLVNENLY